MAETIVQEAVTVVEIDPNKKYIITFSHLEPGPVLEAIRVKLQNWLKSDVTFLLISPDVMMVMAVDTDKRPAPSSMEKLS